MQKLVQGIHDFQKHVFGRRRAFFERLAQEQRPQAMFITCSDSRINPNMMTQTDPGELFIVRNGGNIVPHYDPRAISGEAAAIEFAISALGVSDIILCGHSHCGAMKGLLDEPSTEKMPAVRAWLAHAGKTRQIMREKYAHLSGDALLTATVEENTLVQLENLRTHPAVIAGLASGQLTLHAWVYKIDTGEMFAFNPEEGQYFPLSEREATTKHSPPR